LNLKATPLGPRYCWNDFAVTEAPSTRGAPILTGFARRRSERRT
jgi:hypothetical protein